MLYSEPIPHKNWWLPVLAAVALMYLPFLGARELQAVEALRVAAAVGIRGGGSWFVSTVGGETAPMFPLHTWLTAFCGWFGLSPEWSVRLPSVFGVVALAGVCGRYAARAAGHLAGAVAAAMAAGSILILGHGRVGGGDVLVAALLTMGWLIWYRHARVARDWGTAWVLGPVFAALAFFGAGIMAVVYFYLPLFFLRRPLRIWPRFWGWRHLLSLGGLAVLALWWAKGVPGQTLFPWKTMGDTVAAGGYFRHLLFFPLSVFVLFLPWSMLAWPGICSAFRSVERTPIFCRFLRRLILVLFFAGWFLPSLFPLAAVLMVGPLSVLAGVHAGILFRRYHDAGLWLIPRILSLTAAVLGAVVGVVAVLHVAGVVEISGLNDLVTLSWKAKTTGVGAYGCLAVATGALLLGGWLWCACRKGTGMPFWLRMTGAVAAMQLAILSFHPAWRALFFECHRENARILGADVPPKAVMYKIHNDYLMRELVYMGRDMRSLEAADKLPVSGSDPVYVLTGEKPPMQETRTWVPCSPPVFWKRSVGVTVAWNPRAGCLVRLSPSSGDGAGETGTAFVRMYRGTLKPAVEESSQPTAKSMESAKGILLP